MSKFQKGDRVVYHWHDAQLALVVGVVKGVATDGSVNVRWPSGGSGWYDPEELLHELAAGTETEAVEHPAHYGGDTTYEAIKVIEAWGLGFALGNLVKYVARAGKKDPAAEVQDLRKAAFYLQRRIDQLTI